MRRLSDYAHCGRRQGAVGASRLTAGAAVSKHTVFQVSGTQKKVRYLVVHAPSNNT